MTNAELLARIAKCFGARGSIRTLTRNVERNLKRIRAMGPPKRCSLPIHWMGMPPPSNPSATTEITGKFSGYMRRKREESDERGVEGCRSTGSRS